MGKFINERNELTLEGKEVLKKFIKPLVNLVSKDMNEMSDTELCVFDSLMSKLVGDTISIELQKRWDKKSESELYKLSDEEFIEYLQNKYGNNYFLVSLTDEEYDRCEPISQKKVKEIIDNWGAAVSNYPQATTRNDIFYRQK
jgi:hypothetical protein